ncbi:MAG: 3-dehydroquinate synthase [Chitinophagales bacterium]|nr:3-dehydroquinate synthase [Chitinophagales bacterium]MDW8418977.1 3-dehydroquinate synthase [Chitinophagales bacterium]
MGDEHDVLEKLPEFISRSGYRQVFVLADENTLRYCYPILEPLLDNHVVIHFPAGESHKTLNTSASVWQQLLHYEADRNALLINLGGGTVTDLGGFVAGCYKRGIDFVNIPTTLLGMVDAATGGKTGIDFAGYKNALGLFRKPVKVFLHTPFLHTLPEREFMSGMAEVIKHALIADRKMFENLPDDCRLTNHSDLHQLVIENIKIKNRFVSADFHDNGIRMALNYGHTIGHALESLWLEKQQLMLHGEAVAGGILAESYLSHRTGLLSAEELEKVTKKITKNFRLPIVPAEDFGALMHYLRNDKKNRNGKITCCLLSEIGSYSLPHFIEEGLITDALNYYNLTVCNG